MIRSCLLRSLLFVLAPTLGLADDGVNSQITSVRFTTDRRPVVTFKINDVKGKPLDIEDLDPNSVKFTIAAIKAETGGETSYHNYILTKVSGKDYVYKNQIRPPRLAESLQPDFDRGGSLAKSKPGIFTYTFKTPLPSGYDRKATHVVGGELTRDKGRFVANPLFEFVPNGAQVKVQRSVVETATCNNCHDPLKYHGGTRRAAGYCALCHTSQLSDPETGESLEFKVFVHKIHRGKLLPSVRDGKPYFLVGAAQQVTDYSNLRYTQVVMSDGTAKDLRNCKACHAGAKQENWKQFPSALLVLPVTTTSISYWKESPCRSAGRRHVCRLPSAGWTGVRSLNSRRAHLSRLVDATSGHRLRHSQDRQHQTGGPSHSHFQLEE